MTFFQLLPIDLITDLSYYFAINKIEIILKLTKSITNNEIFWRSWVKHKLPYRHEDHIINAMSYDQPWSTYAKMFGPMEGDEIYVNHKITEPSILSRIYGDTAISQINIAHRYIIYLKNYKLQKLSWKGGYRKAHFDHKTTENFLNRDFFNINHNLFIDKYSDYYDFYRSTDVRDPKLFKQGKIIDYNPEKPLTILDSSGKLTLQFGNLYHSIDISEPILKLHKLWHYGPNTTIIYYLFLLTISGNLFFVKTRTTWNHPTPSVEYNPYQEFIKILKIENDPIIFFSMNNQDLKNKQTGTIITEQGDLYDLFSNNEELQISKNMIQDFDSKYKGHIIKSINTARNNFLLSKEGILYIDQSQNFQSKKKSIREYLVSNIDHKVVDIISYQNHVLALVDSSQPIAKTEEERNRSELESMTKSELIEIILKKRK